MGNYPLNEEKIKKIKDRKGGEEYFLKIKVSNIGDRMIH